MVGGLLAVTVIVVGTSRTKTWMTRGGVRHPFATNPQCAAKRAAVGGTGRYECAWLCN